jgi:hypothetical protein
MLVKYTLCRARQSWSVNGMVVPRLSVKVDGEILVVEVRCIDSVLGFKRSMTVPLERMVSVSTTGSPGSTCTRS